MTSAAERLAHTAGYVLSDILDESGSSLLYRAVRSADETSVVLRLPREAEPSRRTLAAFHREYEVLRTIDTVGVARVMALEIHERAPLLVFEDSGLERPLLEVRQRCGPMPLDRFFTVALALADAVGSLHQLGIVHNSIRSSNILVDATLQQVRLIGFEQATRLPEERMSVRVGERLAEHVLATMSPEQTGRVNRSVDYRTDLYSLGVVLYQLLCGVSPFEAEDASGWVFAHVAVDPTPLAVHRPDLPPSLGEIVGKLLEKAPEKRYQNASGLRRDLLAVQRGEPVHLRQVEDSGRFRLPERLYGREVETAALLSAFERSARGSRQLVLVSGYSGVGKTALVLQLHRPLVESRAQFASGKFDQYQRAVPYSAIRAALRELIVQLVGEPDGQAGWRGRISEELGENLPVVTDVVPELELLVGPQPAPSPLGAGDAQARFQLAFRKLVGVLAQPAHPLVLFLDDVQWIDLASLKLVEDLLEAEELSHLLVIGAYRDNEVGPSHPLHGTARRLAAAQAVTRLELSPLSLEHLVSLVSDGLSCAPQEGQPLARLLHTKTAGNPFFVGQFLRLLHLEGLLTFDVQRGSWGWDLERAAALSATENVVDLMVRHLQRLSPPCQEALRLAACLGNRFDLRTLSMVHGDDAHQVQLLLWPALKAGLLTATGDSREFHELGPGGAVLIDGHADAIGYRFLHDRVQQGAYSLVPDEERKQLHLRIGRTLREVLSEEELEQRIFDVVGHFVLAPRDLVEPDERLAVAQLCARAAERAVASTAYATAIRHAELGLDLLGPDPWALDDGLTLSLQQLLGECQGLTGEFERAEQTLRAAIDRCRSSLDRVGLLTVLMEAYVSSGQVGLALQALIDMLAEFGVELGADTVEEVASGAAAAVARARGGRSLEDIVASDEAQDPETTAILRALGSSIDTAYMSGHAWVTAITSIAACAALEKGVTASASMIFSTYGLTAQEPPTASGFKLRHEYGRIGARLAERFGDLAWISRSHVSNPHLYGTPFRQVVELQQRGVEAGWASGAFTWGAYAELERACMRLAAGDPLPEVREELETRRVRVDRAQRVVSGVCLSLLEGLIASLSGRSQDRLALGRDAPEAAELQAAAAAMGPYVEAKRFTFKLLLAAIFGDYEGARALRRSAAGVRHGLIGLPCEHLYQLASALTLAGLHAQASPEEAPQLLAELNALEVTYREHALANADYEPASHLVRGLAAEAAGTPDRATEDYNQAVAAARERGQLHVEALANERAGGVSLRLGRERLAAFYLGEATAAYGTWGATAKALELAQGPSLAPAASETPSALRLGDAESLLKTSLAILGELRLEEQLRRQLELVLENVGAQRGLLLLEQDGALVVAVESRLTPAGLRTTLGEVELSPSTRRVVEHVRRTTKTLIMDDAWSDQRFGIATQPEAERPRSVLCMPIVRKPQLAAVLYLDTRAAARWFTPAQQDTLQFLSALATTSLQNALFYRDLQLEVEERKRAESKLRSERDFWTRVIARIPVVVRGLQPDGTTTFLNPTGQRLTGYTEQELIGKNWWRLFYPGKHYQQVEELLPKMASGEQHTSYERTLVDRHGQAHLISWTSANLFDSEQRLVEVVEFGRDITEQRKLEAEAAALEEHLRLAQKLETIGTLAGGIAHDFNNILTPIIGLSDLVRLRVKGDPVTDKYIEGILQSAERAKGLVARILTFSSQGLEADRSAIRLQDLIDEVLVLLRASLPTTIEIRREVDPDCPPVLANSDQMHQVLLNLCANAGHAMQGAGVLTLRLGRANDRVRLVVTDTGSGMDEATRQRVFEPFFTTKATGEGTGLGLSVVHGIVKGHQGSIEIESSLGEGSSFTLEFPSHDSTGTPSSAETVEPQTGEGRVLLVDDEPLIMRLTETNLSRLGYKTLGFTSSPQALEAFREEPDSFLALLTDYTMPGLTGLALAAEVHRIRPDLPVVLMTGLSPTTEMPSHVSALLSKPFRSEELAAVLSRVCLPR